MPTVEQNRQEWNQDYEWTKQGAGLQCISQELVNWGTDELLIDCFSLFTPKNSIWARPNNVIENTVS
jgi:hypothetical protein